MVRRVPLPAGLGVRSLAGGKRERHAGEVLLHLGAAVDSDATAVCARDIADERESERRRVRRARSAQEEQVEPLLRYAWAIVLDCDANLASLALRREMDQDASTDVRCVARLDVTKGVADDDRDCPGDLLSINEELWHIVVGDDTKLNSLSGTLTSKWRKA